MRATAGPINRVISVGSARYPHTSVFGLNPGFIKSSIRSNLFASETLFYRFIEWMTGLIAASAETYAKGITSLLFSTDIERHSGTMFDRKGRAVLPSPRLTDDAYRQIFITASDALVSRANVRFTS